MNSKAASTVAKAIKANNKMLGAHVASGNSAALAKMYARGAKVMPPNADFVRAKDIAGFWQFVVNSGIRGATLKTLEVEVHGTTAIEVGTYVMAGADGTALDNGKYIVVWKKEGSSWKLYRDIFNSSRPKT